MTSVLGHAIRIASASAFILCFCSGTTHAYPWPLDDQDSQHSVGATCGEARSPSESTPHVRFHKGLDMAGADGTDVFSVAAGRVSFGGQGTANAYIKVGEYVYIHTDNYQYSAEEDAEAEVHIADIMSNHLHFQHVFTGGHNPLLHLEPFTDNTRPSLLDIRYRWQGGDFIEPGRDLRGNVDIIVRARDWVAGTENDAGVYTIDYQLYYASGPKADDEACAPRMLYTFNGYPNNSLGPLCYEDESPCVSNNNTFWYIVTNTGLADSYWGTPSYDDCRYRIRVRAGDIQSAVNGQPTVLYNERSWYVNVDNNNRGISP